MYSIKLDWKTFNVCLATVEAWAKANTGDQYVGNSSDSQFTLWFTEEPSQSVKEDIQAYWSALAPGCPEAVRYASSSLIQEKTATLKAGLASKDWSNMSFAERKLVLNQPLTREDLGL